MLLQVSKISSHSGSQPSKLVTACDTSHAKDLLLA